MPAFAGLGQGANSSNAGHFNAVPVKAHEILDLKYSRKKL
jgi:hypothetical protein